MKQKINKLKQLVRQEVMRYVIHAGHKAHGHSLALILTHSRLASPASLVLAGVLGAMIWTGVLFAAVASQKLLARHVQNVMVESANKWK